MSGSHATPATRLATVLAALGGAVLAATLAAVVLVVVDPWSGDHPPHQPTAARALVADRPEVRAAGLLRDWDRRRSQAWAAGDEAALATLYVDGSPAAEADRAMLRDWTRRGLRVDGLRTQVLRVEVLAHRSDRWDLAVVDRVAGGRVATADPADGPVSARLPRDTARASRVVLVRDSAGSPWRVEQTADLSPTDVSPARSAAPP